jgi:hypothetical protein
MKNDPIDRFYAPLASAEKFSDISFWIAAILSIIALQIEKSTSPVIYEAVQSAFAFSVMGVFILGLAARLYWSSRAQSKRLADFVSNAFDVPLIPERSQGFFNNLETGPFRRMAASLLENTLFTKAILQRMLRNERIKVVVYACVWLIALLNRATDLALITGIAQVILSEQIISKWIRMEWLRARVEGVYEDVYSLIQSTGNAGSKEINARVIEYLLRYETAKSQAGISLSTSIFKRINPAVSAEWRKTVSELKLSI